MGCEDLPRLTGRTALVTGANRGIGFAVAAGLAGAGARVLLGTRDHDRGAAAMHRLRAEVPGARAGLLPLDLADLDSVREAVRLTPDPGWIC